MNVSTKTAVSVPILIKAACRETRGTEVEYAKWNTSQKWVKDTADDYATYIYDIHALKIAGRDSTNTYNLLGMASGKIPEDNSYSADHLLISKTYEFGFEWWFAGASYTHSYRGTGADSAKVFSGISFASSTSNDSLRAFESAVGTLKENMPDTIKSVRVQLIKVVLADSRKPVQSSSSEQVSSSSKVPESSSVVASCSSQEKSSSSENPVSSSSEKKSSSSEVKPSSSNTPNSSSSANPKSSSSEKTTRIQVSADAVDDLRVLQVRRLDGTVMNNAGKLSPGVYYIKYSDGLWKKTAVMPK